MIQSLETFVDAHFDKLSPEQAAEFEEIDFDLTKELSIDELMQAAGGVGEETEETTASTEPTVPEIPVPDPVVPTPTVAPAPQKPRVKKCITKSVNGIKRTTCIWTRKY